MTICFNLLSLYGYQGQEASIRQTIHLLTTEYPEDNFVIVFSKNLETQFQQELRSLASPKRTIFVSQSNRFIGQLFDMQCWLPWILRKRKMDWVWSASPFFPILFGKKNIVTIHDCAYDVVPEEAPMLSRIILRFFYHAANILASWIITVSAFSKNELTTHYRIPPKKITILPNIIDLPEKTLISIETLPKKPFFVCLGMNRPRKNVLRTLDAFCEFHQLHPEYSLVLLGKKDSKFFNLRNEIQMRHLENAVLQTGFISNEQKNIFLTHATALLMPSTYEGFGIPVIEAQALGTPAIISSTSSLPEIAGTQTISVDPFNTHEIVAALERINRFTEAEKVLYGTQGEENAKRFQKNTLAPLYRNFMSRLRQ